MYIYNSSFSISYRSTASENDRKIDKLEETFHRIQPTAQESAIALTTKGALRPKPHILKRKRPQPGDFPRLRSYSYY